MRRSAKEKVSTEIGTSKVAHVMGGGTPTYRQRSSTALRMSEKGQRGPNSVALYYLKGQSDPMASSQQVVSPNRKPHLMAAYTTVVDADVCVGLVWYSFGTSDLHLFPAPTLRQFGRARN